MYLLNNSIVPCVVEGCCHEQVLEAVAVDVGGRQGVAKLAGEGAAGDNHLDVEQLRVTLDEDDNLKT